MKKIALLATLFVAQTAILAVTVTVSTGPKPGQVTTTVMPKKIEGTGVPFGGG